jgi:hypothetical protein
MEGPQTSLPWDRVYPIIEGRRAPEDRLAVLLKSASGEIEHAWQRGWPGSWCQPSSTEQHP